VKLKKKNVENVEYWEKNKKVDKIFFPIISSLNGPKHRENKKIFEKKHVFSQAHGLSARRSVC